MPSKETEKESEGEDDSRNARIARILKNTKGLSRDEIHFRNRF